MTPRKPMLTMSQVMNVLMQRGITKEFRMNDKGEMKILGEERVYRPYEMKILKSYRFEGDSNPDDNAVLYVAESSEGEVAMIIDSYGADSNYPGDKFDNFLREIPIEERDEYNME